MGNVKQVTQKELQKIVKFSNDQYKTFPWHITSLTVIPFLDLNTYLSTINSIIADCRGPDGNIMVELVPFSIRLHIINAYSFVDLPEDINEIYYIVYNSDLYETVINNVNCSQVDSIINSVNSIVSRGERHG